LQGIEPRGFILQARFLAGVRNDGSMRPNYGASRRYRPVRRGKFRKAPRYSEKEFSPLGAITRRKIGFARSPLILHSAPCRLHRGRPQGGACGGCRLPATATRTCASATRTTYRKAAGTMTRCNRPSLTCAGCRAAPASATEQEAYMPTSTCFSYPESASPGRHEPTNTACFSYPADEPSGQRGGRTNSACFSYLDYIPPGGAIQPGPGGKTSTTCFRY